MKLNSGILKDFGYGYLVEECPVRGPGFETYMYLICDNAIIAMEYPCMIKF